MFDGAIDAGAQVGGDMTAQKRGQASRGDLHERGDNDDAQPGAHQPAQPRDGPDAVVSTLSMIEP